MRRNGEGLSIRDAKETRVTDTVTCKPNSTEQFGVKLIEMS